MSEMPERIWAWLYTGDFKRGEWLGRKSVTTDVEYVRADLYAALEAKIAEKETALWARFKDILSALEATPPAPKVTEAIVVCPDCDGQKLMHGYDCDCPRCAAAGVVPLGTAIRSIIDDDDADVFEKLADIRRALTAAQEAGKP